MMFPFGAGVLMGGIAAYWLWFGDRDRRFREIETWSDRQVADACRAIGVVPMCERWRNEGRILEAGHVKRSSDRCVHAFCRRKGVGFPSGSNALCGIHAASALKKRTR